MLEQLPDIRPDISLTTLAFLLAGLFFISIAIARIRHRKIFSAGIHGMLGALLLVSGCLLLAIAFNLLSYQRLTYEREIAVVSFEQISSQRYRATLENKEQGMHQQFMLNGDEWQLDARILRWTPAAQLIGLNAQYRLERLGGRYRDVNLERSLPRTVHLLGKQTGLDIWSMARRYHDWFPWIDAYYGNATYMPMHDNARFSVSINQYGIMARPVGTVAEQAIFEWD